MKTKRLGYVAMDQYGTTHHIDSKYPRQWLLNYYGRKHADKIYHDNLKTGKTDHVGWVIAGHWFNVYQVFPLH